MFIFNDNNIIKQILIFQLMFDLHWHARDLGQREKDTVVHSLQLAYAAGLSGIAAMPNTSSPLIDLNSCREYLALAEKAEVPVEFYVHIGLTSDPEQIRRAVDAYHQEPRIIGMKAFWGKSVGDLAIESKDDQYEVLRTLAQEGYEGVVTGHFEKEAEMYTSLYDPQNPRNWSTLCRPELAEVDSFNDIVMMAMAIGLKGTLHVAHVSTLSVADRVYEWANDPGYLSTGLKLSCGVTPHHLLFDYTKLDNPETARWYKCNPPLRSLETRQGLLERVLDGRIPIIESDHAPHTLDDKQKEVPYSGIVSGHAWAKLPGQLAELGMSPEQISAVLHNNAVKLFDLSLPDERNINPEMLEKLMEHYPFDPFKGVLE
tara:strand:+ start:393 stop:1508 length:1116 start_codon:yes stop_codon:yes gene_type:complete